MPADDGTTADNAELVSRSPRDGRTSCHATLAATNKFLAPINKSRAGGKATKKRIPPKEAGIRRLVRAAPEAAPKATGPLMVGASGSVVAQTPDTATLGGIGKERMA